MSFGELLHKYVVRKEFDDEFKEVSNKYFRSVAHEFSNQKIIHNYSIASLFAIKNAFLNFFILSLIPLASMPVASFRNNSTALLLSL